MIPTAENHIGISIEMHANGQTGESAAGIFTGFQEFYRFQVFTGTCFGAVASAREVRIPVSGPS